MFVIHLDSPARFGQNRSVKNPTALSRRGFTKLLGAGAAYAALRPALGLSESTPKPTDTKSSGVVRLSSNENPYGPSSAALKAMTAGFALAWKYPDEKQDELVEALAKLNQVAKENILTGAGSGEILKVAVAAFTGPEEKLVVGDPTFEACVGHAKASRAEAVKVTLNATYGHDLTKMGDIPGVGLHYVCNPNNPTASITPKAELSAFLAKVPRMRTQQSWDSVSIMAIVAARASLDDAAQVENGRKNNTEVRKFVCGELDKMKYTYIPSQANFMMIDMRREVKPLIAAFKDKKVQVGRLFPPLPNHLRVTIGTKPQMDRFLAAFKELTAA